ncbi:alpha/beta hydrolase family protein [Nocardia sp. NPDC051570]|uniref:alpha/beta hydrolase family protein n=1 Tax=Nocardia sp. NPDC051570 TaxID=3364324 RepID=UPI00379203E8
MRILAAIMLAVTLPMTSAAYARATDATNVPPTSAITSPTTQLPAPTGPFAVGRNVVHLVDTARKDPWIPAQPRELMVSMYYPAQQGGGQRAPYATDEEIRLLLAGQEMTGVPVQALSKAGTNAVVDAAPVNGSYPLVVLSPGFTASRYTLTALSEELASRGYVVAAVDHAGESFGTEFPGGRMSTCVACKQIDAGTPLSVVAETRAHDVAFLLDSLTAREPVWPHAHLIDTTRIGMAGHSIGGASAAAAMAIDGRVRAGVNMDGSFDGAVPVAGLGQRPFLMLGTDSDSRPGGGGDPSWDEAWGRLRGWKRWLTLVGANHNSFADTLALAEQAGLPNQTALRGGRAVDLTRAYVAAFFDQHLRGVGQPLLDGPAPAYPEVRFNKP